jgi:hypothetical protein
MTIFNYLIDNGIIFYSAIAGTVGFIGYKLVTSKLNSFYVEKGVQTEAGLNNSVSPTFENIPSVTKTTSEVGTQTTSEVGTQTMSDNISTVTTMLPIPPVNTEIIPDSDIIELSFLRSLQELKFKEITELYNEEIIQSSVTRDDLIQIIDSFSIADFYSNDLNELILTIIQY